MNAKKRDAFIQRRFYTQTLSHRDVFHAHTHTQTHFHTETFTRKHFNTQTLLYTDSFTRIRFYMQMPFYRRTHTFTHKRFCTQTQTLFHTDPFTHRRFYTQTLLHTYAFTHGRFYTQTLLHTGAFTHRRFHTQTLLHTDAFPHRPFYTQTLLPLGDLSCKQRCANIVAMEMLKIAKVHKTRLSTMINAQSNARHPLFEIQNKLGTMMDQFVPGHPGAIHDPWSQHCYAAPATEFPRHRTTRMTRSRAPFARTFPSANETATAKRPQTSRVRDFNQTFCIQKFRDMHICSLAFKTMP